MISLSIITIINVNNYNSNSFYYLKREEENIIIPWLKKEKTNEEIKKI